MGYFFKNEKIGIAKLNDISKKKFKDINTQFLLNDTGLKTRKEVMTLFDRFYKKNEQYNGEETEVIILYFTQY